MFKEQGSEAKPGKFKITRIKDARWNVTPKLVELRNVGHIPIGFCRSNLVFARRLSMKIRASQRHGFTLIEVLIVIAIIAILASVLLPSLARSKQSAQRAGCLSNFRQIGLAFSMYVSENADRFPDRRDLKIELGYRPWTTWPPSDPRSGWAAATLKSFFRDAKAWSCAAMENPPFRNFEQCNQRISTETNAPVARYWLWRFDRADAEVPLDNFWGKTEAQLISDLRVANNPQAGIPNGASDVELMVDPYFPNTIATIPDVIRGRAVHPGGRNRLFLDAHASFLKDARTK